MNSDWHGYTCGEVLTSFEHNVGVAFSLAGVNVASNTFSLCLRHGILEDIEHHRLVGDTCIRVRLNGQVLLDNNIVNQWHPFVTRVDLPPHTLGTTDNTVDLDFVRCSDKYILSVLSIEESRAALPISVATTVPPGHCLTMSPCSMDATTASSTQPLYIGAVSECR